VIAPSLDDLEAGQPIDLAIWTGDGEIGPYSSAIRPIGRMAYAPERDPSTRCPCKSNRPLNDAFPNYLASGMLQ